MIKTTQNRIEIANRLLEEKRFKAVLSVLGEIDTHSISPRDRAVVYIMIAEAKLYLGDNDVATLLNEAVRHLKTSGENEYYAKAKYLFGWHLISRGKPIDAKESLLEAYLLYKRYDNYSGQARALNHLSFIAHHSGDMDSAISSLKECLDLYEKIGDNNNHRLVLKNLGQLLRCAGKLSESIDIYNGIDPEAPEEKPRSRAVYYLMLSMACALKGELSIARHQIDKARLYIGDFRREQAIYYEYLGWIHLLEENYRKAEAALQKGLEISLDIAPESALVSQIKRRLADACLGMDRYNDARTYADDALAVAREINERIEIAACHLIYARLACREKDAEAARIWFKRATDMFAMIGAQYELAVTRYLAAASGLYHNGERQALLYLAKEYFVSEGIAPYLERIDRETNRRSRHSAARPVPSDDGAPVIIHADRSMTRLVELARNVARSNMAVLLTGATGTGKDLFAKFIHHHSGRTGRFISVNAAAIPDNMVESELFGYRKGAYTGAAESTSGWIEEADGGTFYLNEIADASPELQAKLLDVIESRRICRLGERRERTIDCRIIAASNHDLDRLINEGRFRLDLYHRLNEIPIELPALNERGRDIHRLVEHFLTVNGVSLNGRPDDGLFNRLVEVFSRRQWPGNVRQLEIEVRRLALLSDRDLCRMVESASRYNPSEREELLALLKQTGWNRREAARILGVNEATIRRRIKKHRLSPN